MMKLSRIVPAIAAGLLLSTVISCRTSEENYREAYEKAVEKQKEGIDSTIYDRIRNEARPGNVVIEGDTLPITTEYVSVTADQGLKSTALKRYQVVVAQFKQLFHAKSMKQRMIDGGYGETFIVQTREPLYYVVVLATDQPSEAAATLHALQTASPVKLIDPCPWVLRAANR